MDTDSFGDRMKLFEQAEAGRMLIPLLPICVRIDGKGFSKWTEGLQRPFDQKLSNLMVETTKYLVKQSNAKIGYCQSDEISLIIYSSSFENQVFFDGKIQKLTSVLASMTTAFFNANKDRVDPSKPFALFDARVWNVPNQMEATNTLLWREQDATKNSISMAAHHYFEHKQVQGKNGSQMQEMLFAEHGINWNDYPAFFKRGTFVQHKKVLRELTPEQLAKIPEDHRPTGPIERGSIETIDMPPFGRVINRVGVVFEGETPQVETATV